MGGLPPPTLAPPRLPQYCGMPHASGTDTPPIVRVPHECGAGTKVDYDPGWLDALEPLS